MPEFENHGFLDNSGHLLCGRDETAGGRGQGPILIDGDSHSKSPLTVRIRQSGAGRTHDLKPGERERPAGFVGDEAGTFAECRSRPNIDALADCADIQGHVPHHSGSVGTNRKMIASHQVETREFKINPVGAIWQRRKLIRSVAIGGRADRTTSALFGDRNEGTGNRPARSIDHPARDTRRLGETNIRKSCYREANRQTQKECHPMSKDHPINSALDLLSAGSASLRAVAFCAVCFQRWRSLGASGRSVTVILPVGAVKTNGSDSR